MAGIVGMGLKVSGEGQFPYGDFHTEKSSQDFVIQAVFHRFRAADAEDLLKGAFPVYRVQHSACQIADEDRLCDMDSAGYEGEGLSCQNEIRQLLLAAVLRIAAQQKTWAVDMAGTKECNVKSVLPFSGKIAEKDFLHLPLVSRIAAFLRGALFLHEESVFRLRRRRRSRLR